MFFDQEKILEHVDLLNQAVRDKYPDSRIYIILIGASSLIVKDSLDKHTQHFCSIKTNKNKPFGIGGMLQELGFHVISEALMDFHPDYIDRLENIVDKENISILSIHPYDILIAKIGQGMQKDIDDFLGSKMLSKVDIGKLDKLYYEATSYWIGDPEKFSRNWERFIEHVHQRRPDFLL